MMYTDFVANGNAYKLRLNTRDVVNLEKQLGCNPMSIFGNGKTLPTVTVMVQILHASLQPYHHGINLDKAYAIFDEWLEDGNAMTDFLAVIIDIYKVSGLIPKEVEETEVKN